MIGKKLQGSEPMPLVEVKKLVEERKKEGELSYEQNLTLEYTKKFSKINLTTAGKLTEELLQIEKLNKAHAVALVDLMPKNADEVKLIFAKERFVLEDGDINKVLEAVNKYRK